MLPNQQEALRPAGHLRTRIGTLISKQCSKWLCDSFKVLGIHVPNWSVYSFSLTLQAVWFFSQKNKCPFTNQRTWLAFGNWMQSSFAKYLSLRLGQSLNICSPEGRWKKGGPWALCLLCCPGQFRTLSSYTGLFQRISCSVGSMTGEAMLKK